MIDIQTIATGSTGNCYVIKDSDTQILIECGIPFQKIQQALNFKTSELAACLVSHSHQDHCKGLSGMLKASVDCYMSKTTADEIGISHNRIKLLETKKQFRVGTFTILPFDLQHDVENHGFLLQSDNGSRLLFITDSYYCKYRFPKINYLMIECNYSQQILDANVESGRVHNFLRKRVMRSHFSLENLLIFLKVNDLSKVREIHLLHLSDSNSDEALFKKTVQAATGKVVIVNS